MGLTNPSVMASGIVIGGRRLRPCAGDAAAASGVPDATFRHKGLQRAVEVAYQFEGDRT